MIFLAFVSKVGNENTYKMKRWIDIHTCGRVLNNNSSNSKWVTKTVTARMESFDGVIRDIIYEIRNNYVVGIIMNRAWKAKKIAKALVKGDAAKKYNMLWRCSAKLKRINSNNNCKINMVIVGATIQPSFGSFYFCLDEVKKGVCNIL